MKKSDVIKRNIPWGINFATRSNFKAGFFKEEARLVKKYLKKPCNVLVIGSGNGREARPICFNSHNIVCMDIGAFYLNCGKAFAEKEGIQDIKFVQADAIETLPFAKRSFRFVFSSIYSSLGKSRSKLMHNIHRIMQPDGMLLHLSCTLLYPNLYHPFATYGWVWIKNTKQLAEEVLRCGFDLIESEVDPIRPEYRFSVLQKIPKSNVYKVR
jgi:ubiquinone/menaquinone biosynthesis C-methylase UbiE